MDERARHLAVNGRQRGRGRVDHRGRRHRQGVRGPGRAPHAGAERRLPPAHAVGRPDPPAPRAGQRRHAGRRPSRPRLRRRGHRPLPHRAHVLRRRPAHRDARDDRRAGQRRPRARAGQAAADAARRLRGDLPRDGGLPGHHPAARPAAARVPAQGARRDRGAGAASSRSRVDALQARDRPARRGESHARAPRLPAGHHLSRDHQHAGARDLRGRRAPSRRARVGSCRR